jgi:hypothetical protein
MCDAVPGYRGRALSAGEDPGEQTDMPPEGFVRLAPAPPSVVGSHLDHAKPGVSVVSTLVAMVTAGLAVLQAFIPWGPWRVALQAGGVLVMFSALGLWARLNQSAALRASLCSCERPPVWIRVVPSIAGRRSAQDRNLMEQAQTDVENSLAGANRLTGSKV